MPARKKFAVVVPEERRAELNGFAKKMSCTASDVVRFAVTYVIRKCERDAAYSERVRLALGGADAQAAGVLQGEPAA